MPHWFMLQVPVLGSWDDVCLWWTMWPETISLLEAFSCKDLKRVDLGGGVYHNTQTGPLQVFQMILPNAHENVMSGTEEGNEWLLRGLMISQGKLALDLSFSTSPCYWSSNQMNLLQGRLGGKCSSSQGLSITKPSGDSKSFERDSPLELAIWSGD